MTVILYTKEQLFQLSAELVEVWRGRNTTKHKMFSDWYNIIELWWYKQTNNPLPHEMVVIALVGAIAHAEIMNMNDKGTPGVFTVAYSPQNPLHWGFPCKGEWIESDIDLYADQVPQNTVFH